MNNIFLTDLIESYQQTVQNMDHRIIYPYSEFDIQPLYAKEYQFYLKDKLDSLQLTRNFSQLRSLLIMDLIDYFILDQSPKQLLIRYNTILNQCYPDDPLSLSLTNRPKNSGKERDFQFYPSNIPESIELLSCCFAYSHAKNYDIFTGLTYECTGPFFNKGFVFTVTEFYELKLKFIHFIEKWRPYSGGIDLFGHSTMMGLNQLAVLFNNQYYLNDKNVLQKLINHIKKYTSHEIQLDKKRTPFDKICVMIEKRLSLYPNSDKYKSVLFDTVSKNMHIGYQFKDQYTPQRFLSWLRTQNI